MQQSIFQFTIPFGKLVTPTNLEASNSTLPNRQQHGKVTGQVKPESVDVLMQARPENQPSDQEYELKLINRVQTGDFAAVEELYGRYSRQAFGLALKILNSNEAAEDAVQDAFLRFWKQPKSFDASRGKFSTWLLSVVHNLCIDQLRRKRNKAVSIDQQEAQEHLSYLADEQVAIEEEVWQGMQRKVIRKALDKLPVEQRRVIELAFFNGLTHQEIASATGQPLGTIKSRIRQGLMKLKGMMQEIE
ncbi:MAG: sigma-70 family RNA polymerase sigma factor [Chloroflexi bacterium]|nr:sigma-70 family RNA polymerase sigma factor [Chloroflexota bacterium]